MYLEKKALTKIIEIKTNKKLSTYLAERSGQGALATIMKWKGDSEDICSSGHLLFELSNTQNLSNHLSVNAAILGSCAS